MRSPFSTRLLGSRRTPATAPKAEALRKSGPSGRDRSHWDNSACASSTSCAPSSFPPQRRSDLQAVGPASPTFLSAVWRARDGSQPGNGSKRDCPGPAGAAEAGGRHEVSGRRSPKAERAPCLSAQGGAARSAAGKNQVPPPLFITAF